MDKSYRIHTDILNDKVLNVNMKQDFEFLEVLTMKLAQKDAYKIHSSNYGVIVGRVLANDAFGIPNAKVSVFIEKDGTDSTEVETLYPYNEVTSKDRNSRRYNLLPDYSDDECYRIVGTFPNKRLLLDEDTYLEIYDKYWKYSTVTNNSGDYMIFGIPVGSQTIHTDIDLSDIGILSQKPRDFLYKGYNINEFDNANQFKESTNLDSLKQIVSQNKSAYVYPFWGDADNGIAAITRCDIDVDYKFEPTCIFMGAIVSDNEANAIGHKCAPEVDNGMNNQLIAGEGTIEMIRKTTDGLVEEYPIQGNRLIDSDGVWCYQIPMNLDYIGTDEYGNVVPTDNPNKGIPTRTQVRFRFSKTDTGEEGHSRHTAKYLVPMNPLFYEGDESDNPNEDEKIVIPKSKVSGEEYENMYTFGSNTPISCFRDLYWNNVYSVKNYIPKTQVAHRAYSTNYSALKGANLVDDQNPIPFNKLRVDLPFMYMIVCIIFTIVMWVVTIINFILSMFYWLVHHLCLFKGVSIFGISLEICPFEWLFGIVGLDFTCISLGGNVSEDNTAYYPGCSDEAMGDSSCPDDMDGCERSNNNTDLMDNVQRKLANDFKIIKLDLYQDWINGSLYMPLWYWRKRKKRTFLFGLFSRSAVNTFCNCDNTYSRLKTSVTCDIAYNNTSFKTSSDIVLDGEDRWHKAKSMTIKYPNGLIKPVTNKDGLTAYYYVAMQPTADNPTRKITDYKAEKFNVIRLYATDIILLGNINEDNLYGIPQFFKVLPSTTANIPPIATIQENETDIKNDMASKYDIMGGEDSGITITTGMDWGNDGADATPTYKDGLFFDLGCTSVLTKAKSCINVERMSELGVNLDMQYDYAYSRGGDIRTDKIDSDGFISKYELDDLNNRSMFATLNHIGFVPQQYLDDIAAEKNGKYNKLTTQVPDKNTNYLVPKFRYLFPVDFDGRMQPIMDGYNKGFAQALYDDPDEAYITFRLGADKEGRYGRARHFYIFERNEHYWHMPVFNNSFYFYFGINKGSTAIDKFNNLYMADCFQNAKDPFSLNISVRAKSYCPSMYNQNSEEYKDKGYSEIYVESDDIQIPYSYILYDSYGKVVTSTNGKATASKVGVTTSSFRIGKNDENLDENFDLINQRYKLIVTDDNGKTIKKTIDMVMPKISFSYDSYRLGTKFYTTKVTRMDNICNLDYDYYGRFVISNITIDGYDTQIQKDGVTISFNEDKDQYEVRFKVKTEETNEDTQTTTKILESEMFLTINILKSEYVGKIRDCMCDLENNITTKDNLEKDSGYVDYTDFGNVLKLIDISEDINNPIWALEFDVFQPNSFSVSLSQVCDDKVITGNTANEIVAVNNGENFNVYLNSMPVLFMLGTNNDSVNMDIANESYFYRSGKNRYATDARDRSVIGWYGVHQEDSYQFGRNSLMAIEENQIVWEDFLRFDEGFLSPLSKLKILQYKFRKMFTLSTAIYDIDSPSRLQLTATGGVQPVLNRSVVPDYENGIAQYAFDDKGYVDVPKDKPTITYDDVYTGVPKFNKSFGNFREKAGNYFGAFTNNAGYRNRTTLDKGMASARIPNYASVSPMQMSIPKPIGKKAMGIIESFPYVYNSDFQTLDGDIRRFVNPYLRVMTVDRRLDYDLVMFGPVKSQFNLYSVDENEKVEGKNQNLYIDRNRTWKNGRIVGRIYGGIEMSFDEEYNIITANTTYNKTTSIHEEDGVRTEVEIDDLTLPPVSAEPSTLLEYSYEFDSTDSDSKTIYNMPEPSNVVWEKDGINVTDNNKVITRRYGYKLKPGVTVENGIVYEDMVEQVIEHPSINRKYYALEYAGVDLRDYVWSYNNEVRLKEYVSGDTGQGGSGIKAFWNCLNEPYVYMYPSFNRTDFNGNFDRESVRNGNYPSRRFIDVGNIVQTSLYDFFLSSCSYDGAVNVKNGEITARVKQKSSSSVNITASMDESPVVFYQPEANNNELGNVNYKLKSQELKETFNGWYDDSTGQRQTFNEDFKIFISDNLYLVFSLTTKSSGGFNVYTFLPIVIRVFPRFKKTIDGEEVMVDGITYLKTLAPAINRERRGTRNKEIPEIFEIGNPFDLKYAHYIRDKIDGHNYELMIYEFAGKPWALYAAASELMREFFLGDGDGYDTLLPEGCVYTDCENILFHGDGTTIDGVMLYKESSGMFLPSNSEEFANVKFIRNISLGKNKVVTILVPREYIATGNKDGRLKRVVTLEFSELIDCRDIYLRIDKDKEKSYVTYKPTKMEGTASVSGTVEVPVIPDENSTNASTRGNETKTEPVTSEGKVEGDVQVYFQTICFEFCMKLNKSDPELSSSQIFNNPNVGYTFVFSKKVGNTVASYELESTETSARTYSATTSSGEKQDEFVTISIPINFTQEMGLIYEDEWNCYVLISTGTLKYKVGEFGIGCDDNKDDLPTTEGGTAGTNAWIKAPYKLS